MGISFTPKMMGHCGEVLAHLRAGGQELVFPEGPDRGGLDHHLDTVAFLEIAGHGGDEGHPPLPLALVLSTDTDA